MATFEERVAKIVREEFAKYHSPSPSVVTPEHTPVRRVIILEANATFGPEELFNKEGTDEKKDPRNRDDNGVIGQPGRDGCAGFTMETRIDSTQVDDGYGARTVDGFSFRLVDCEGNYSPWIGPIWNGLNGRNGVNGTNASNIYYCCS